MTLEEKLNQLRSQYRIVAEIDLSTWTNNYAVSVDRFTKQLQSIRQDSYEPDQRIVLIHQHDYFVDNDLVGLILKNIQVKLNDVDISNFFVVVLSTADDIDTQMQSVKSLSLDQVPLNYEKITGEFVKHSLSRDAQAVDGEYRYGSVNPIKIGLSQLSEREQFLLAESKVFCMYPWIHIHAYPTGEAYPCCHAEYHGKIGNCKTQTLEQIWNSSEMKTLRHDMLNERENSTCRRCYEQEASGFFSGRQSSNKHHGHQISKVANTHNDGHVDKFELTYWDIRFSNLCNLRCRSCGHIFSTQWYQDQVKIAGPAWKQKNKVLNYAGRTETDIWEQLEPHLDYVDQIYFAGGEPLLMEEHYQILDELVRRGRFDVRLIYNTNFTHTDLKGKSVFEYWKQFQSVAIGASLDDSGARGEYIRKGTDWAVVEQNRRDMMRICPEVDFYISPTLSIMNAWHLPDFHREWVEKGLMRAQDLNVNILQDPVHYRIDIAPPEYKQKIQQKYEQHLEWLRSQDHLRRATVGFESAIKFMNATDNTKLIPQFWFKTDQLDAIRDENILDVIPELAALKK